MIPAHTKYPLSSGTGPNSAAESGDQIIGPFTTRLIPASPSAGTRSMARIMFSSIRSRSSAKSSCPNSCGVPPSAQNRTSFSYAPTSSPSPSCRR